VLSYPGRANFARDAIRVSRCRELQNQDQMRVIDLRNTRGERPRVDDKLHTLPCRLHGRIGHRFAQAEVVDDNVHRSKLSRAARTRSRIIPELWPRRAQ
jgi:hypothetical protein